MNIKDKDIVDLWVILLHKEYYLIVINLVISVGCIGHVHCILREDACSNLKDRIVKKNNCKTKMKNTKHSNCLEFN